MIEVPIEPIEAALKVIHDFNKLDLKNVVLTRKDKPLKMRNLERFCYMGLSNKDYIKMKFYLPLKTVKQYAWKRAKG